MVCNLKRAGLSLFNLLFIGVGLGFAQADSGIVNNQSFEALVQPNGQLFTTKSGNPWSQFVDQTGKHFFKYSGSWMLGRVGDTIYANRNIMHSEPQWWAGPVDTITRLPKDELSWAKVWHVSRSDVELHVRHFNQTGYNMPESIKDWPASHSESNINAYLAPFIDYNGNGKYDPENGDYPSFMGDNAAYFIANDLYGENVLPQSNKLGIEIQGLLYSFSNQEVKNVVYARYYVVNRSDRSYAPFYFGQYVDYQLGNPSDNVIATDVNRNLVYGYNGDNDDESAYGFGANLPAAGCVFFNQPIYSSTAFVRLDADRGYPRTEAEMELVMEGRWRTDKAKIAEGNGLGSGTDSTRYIYPKLTDPDVSAKNWSDESSGEDAGQRNGLGVIRFDGLPQRGFVKIDMAFVVSNSSENTEDRFLEEVDKAKKFFQAELSTYEPTGSVGLKVYPNPLNLDNGVEGWQVELGDGDARIEAVEVTDLSGNKLQSITIEKINSKKMVVPCSDNMAAGIYMIKVVTSNGTAVQKVILEQSN